MSNNNENQINDMWSHFLENPMSGMPPMPAMSSINQGQTSQASISSNPIPMGPSPPCLVNPYSQAYYNQIGYNPVMGQTQTWTESQRLALLQAQIQAQMQAQMAFDFHQQQQQRPRTSQPPLIINENVPDKDSVASADDEDEDEVVEVGRGKRRATKPREKRNWEDDDTLLLARCWVHWSQDPVVGNSQTEGIFWKKVVEMFNNETQHAAHTKSQIHDKWNKIKKGVKAFGAALKKVSEHDRQSGADEQQVVDAAVKLYKKQTGEKFWHYQSCYDLLKTLSNFWNENEATSSRQTPTVDLTADDVPLGGTPIPTPIPTPTPVPFEALFGSDPIRRPRSRNVSRRLSSSSDATSGRSSGSETAQHISSYIQAQQDALRQAKIRDAMKFLAKPIPTGLSANDS